MTKGEQARLTAWRRKVLQQAADATLTVRFFDPSATGASGRPVRASAVTL